MKTNGCPGSRMIDRSAESASTSTTTADAKSELRQWPVQLHLVSPNAPYFQGADVLLCADCVAYAAGNFHGQHLKAKSLAIACPKLDEGQEIYIEKVKALFDEAQINTLTVLTMQVPCCQGLLAMATEGAKRATRTAPIKSQVVSIEGEIIQEEWVNV